MARDNPIRDRRDVALANAHTPACRGNGFAVRPRHGAGIRPNEGSFVDCRLAALVLGPLLPCGIRKRCAELGQVGGDVVAPGDRALVGRLSDRVLSLKPFEGLQIAPQDRVSNSIHDLTRLPHVRSLSSPRDDHTPRTTYSAVFRYMHVARDLIRVLVAIAFSENAFQCPRVVSMLHQVPVWSM